MTRQHFLKEADQYAKYEVPAKDGLLPSDFMGWGIRDEYGWTIAHEAAMHGRLPDDFDQWQLATRVGWSVAHEAAKKGNLPADFDKWDIANNSGLKVADLAREQYAQWRIKAEFGHSDAELEGGRFIWRSFNYHLRAISMSFGCPLPDDFVQWGTEEMHIEWKVKKAMESGNDTDVPVMCDTLW
jgi:hypothetical protein